MRVKTLHPTGSAMYEGFSREDGSLSGVCAVCGLSREAAAAWPKRNLNIVFCGFCWGPEVIKTSFLPFPNCVLALNDDH